MLSNKHFHYIFVNNITGEFYEKTIIGYIFNNKYIFYKL